MAKKPTTKKYWMAAYYAEEPVICPYFVYKHESFDHNDSNDEYYEKPKYFYSESDGNDPEKLSDVEVYVNKKDAWKKIVELKKNQVEIVKGQYNYLLKKAKKEGYIHYGK